MTLATGRGEDPLRPPLPLGEGWGEGAPGRKDVGRISEA